MAIDAGILDNTDLVAIPAREKPIGMGLVGVPAPPVQTSWVPSC